MGNPPEDSLEKHLARFSAHLPPGDLWVFGYGSLMWSPDFRYAERHAAHLYGYHRSLCIYSHRLRGTPEKPGLVLGLCPGGSCWGVAFRIAGSRVRPTLKELWDREMVNHVYEPRMLMVRFGRRAAPALTFIADHRHPQFAGDLSVARTARLVAQGCGVRGQNVDYLANTVAHMDELGLPEGHLHRVLARTRKLCKQA